MIGGGGPAGFPVDELWSALRANPNATSTVTGTAMADAIRALRRRTASIGVAPLQMNDRTRQRAGDARDGLNARNDQLAKLIDAVRLGAH